MPTTHAHDIALHANGHFALSVCDKSLKPDIRGVARLFDLVQRKQVAEFDVRHECPGLGSRIALSTDSRSCFVGCYDVYGLGCYSLPAGEELWRRKDLKSVQQVVEVAHQAQVFCGRQNGAAHLLDAKTGETVKKLSGVRELHGSPYDETVVTLGRSLELHRPLGKKVWSLKVEKLSFDWVYFTRTEFVISFGESIQCFDLASQKLCWTHQPVARVRFQGGFIFNPGTGCYQIFHILDDASRVVSLDSKSGQVIGDTKLPRIAGDFCLGGKALFDGNLCLHSSEDGSLLHDFATDKVLAQDPRYKNALLQSLAANPMTLAELEKYMKAEGFGAQEINKALFIKAMKQEMAKRQKEKQ